MKRILFVDDEKPVLDGLRRTLRAFRKEWDMKFANSGEDALAEMEKPVIEGLWTKIGIRVMDAPSLLKKLKNKIPVPIQSLITGKNNL
jgi:CheY-like chemotaxis protein